MLAMSRGVLARGTVAGLWSSHTDDHPTRPLLQVPTPTELPDPHPTSLGRCPVVLPLLLVRRVDRDQLHQVTLPVLQLLVLPLPPVLLLLLVLPLLPVLPMLQRSGPLRALRLRPDRMAVMTEPDLVSLG